MTWAASRARQMLIITLFPLYSDQVCAYGLNTDHPHNNHSQMSSFQAEVKKMAYSYCEKDQHISEPLSRICIDEKCGNRTLVCALCEEIDHKSHLTMPLKKYLLSSFGGNEKKLANEKSALFYTNQIDNARNGYFKTIMEYKEEVLDMLSTLETQGKIFFNRIHQEALSFVRIQDPMEIIKREASNQAKLKQFFRQVTRIVSAEEKEKFSLGRKLEAVVTNCEDRYKKLAEALNKSKKELQTSMVKIMSTLNANLSFAVKNPVFTWSQQMKGHKIKVTGNIAEQAGMESSGQRFILIEPSLNPLGGAKVKMNWGLRIIKFVGWVGIGICLKNAIVKANYHFNYNNIGHGSYLISSNGYSWSHSVKEFNSAFKTFQFNINDIVYLEYDPVQLKLRFRKNKDGETFELALVPPPDNDEYYPCANICSSGDSVELINPGIELS